MNVSILIPLYNGIEFLETSLSSIKNQTYSHWEVIIGINGHTIESEVYKRAKNYENEKIFVKWYPFKNKVDTLNEMVKDCNYDIICLLDVDDYWLETKLEKQIEILKKGKYDVIGTLCQYFGEQDIINIVDIGELNPNIFYSYNPIINSSIMMQKKDAVWRKLFNHMELEDYDLWLKLNSEGKKFYNISEPLVMHRIHSDSAFNGRNNYLVNTLLSYWKRKTNYQNETQNQIQNQIQNVIESKIITMNNLNDLRSLNTQKFQRMYKIGNKIYYS
jgi:glycosyltransferase involved in cell wall biosynthesis